MGFTTFCLAYTLVILGPAQSLRYLFVFLLTF